MAESGHHHYVSYEAFQRVLRFEKNWPEIDWRLQTLCGTSYHPNRLRKVLDYDLPVSRIGLVRVRAHPQILGRPGNGRLCPVCRLLAFQELAKESEDG